MLAGRKYCLEMYSQDVGTIYGSISNSSLTQINDRTNIGRFCKSGFATILNFTTAMCVEVAQIKTNLNNYTTNVTTPYECEVTDYQSNACQYSYRATNGTFIKFMESFCECSLKIDAGKVGICPFPGQPEMHEYIETMRALK